MLFFFRKFEDLAIGVMDQCFIADRYTVDDVLFNPTQYYFTTVCFIAQLIGVYDFILIL